MQRAIVHLDLDSFFVSCERLANTSLMHMPLLIGGQSSRAVVASCSHEARTFGVRPGMPMGLALRLCPQAKCIKGDMDLYSRHSHTVTQIIEDKAPLFEKASMDEFYVDITGLDKFFGCYKWSGELAQRISKEAGLPLSFSLSVNKTVSKIGTGEAKPLGKMEIKEPMVKPFLNPLSIRKIPMVGDVTFQLLSRIGIRKIQTLSEMPVDMLQKLLGKNGTELWQKANGMDDKPVIPYKEKKSLSSEHTFDEDTIDIVKIKSLLVSMVEKLAFDLRKKKLVASTVAIRFRYNNLDTERKQHKIPYTSFDHLLIAYITTLFDKHYNRRMRIRLVGIELSGLVQGNPQINLFEDTTEQIALYQSIDRIKNRFGDLAVQRGRGSPPVKKPFREKNCLWENR